MVRVFNYHETSIVHYDQDIDVRALKNYKKIILKKRKEEAIKY